MNIIRFWVDTKQSIPPETLQQLKSAYPMVEEKNLGDHAGDILVQLDDKTILMEVKSSPNDFLDFDRLFSQATGMRAITPWSFLLHPDFKYDSANRLMGLWKNGYKPHEFYTRNHIVGALRRVQTIGVKCEPVYNGFVRTVGIVLEWAAKADNGTVTQEKIKLSPFDPADQLTVNLLAWFEGVGVQQAKYLIQWCKEKGITDRYSVLMNALDYFDGKDKPVGWTNHTIERNRKQMQLHEPKKVKTEWEEELE